MRARGCSRVDSACLNLVTAQWTMTALPVLECIDFVSDVGGVDQAPQNVVVEVTEA
ncbi:hypothetical protein FRC0456_00163 [Corynebacterium diphtheriae]|nr:hypothetical protein CIP107517_00174 [Corynebacterium diphtheriae]CAB0581893.1 hypothetical protein CIP107535_00144 [Corynebacterium diphtheriae]CAB0585946.1 hypothetical protein CIP107545_00361 [Corynebacterium diphtheriae]CAB0628468.1 hypothetical protein CIP107565_00198 [Corynebacterium diphtheriae]CAB0675176.1 hypothetical protein FRC0084_00169 [Corynebacterium diphtheriae]